MNSSSNTYDGEYDSHSSHDDSSDSREPSCADESLEEDDDFGSEQSEGEISEELNARSRSLYEARLRRKQMNDVADLHGQVSLDAFCVGCGLPSSAVLKASHLFVLYKASPVSR